MLRALDIGGDRVFCDGVVEGENQDHVADGLRQHEHAKHRDNSGKYSYGDIESEGKQDPEPDEVEALRLHTIHVIQSDDHSPKDHKRNRTAGYLPGYTGRKGWNDERSSGQKRTYGKRGH